MGAVGAVGAAEGEEVEEGEAMEHRPGGCCPGEAAGRRAERRGDGGGAIWGSGGGGEGADGGGGKVAASSLSPRSKLMSETKWAAWIGESISRPARRGWTKQLTGRCTPNSDIAKSLTW